MNKTLQTLSIIALTLIMTACASRGGYQPLPPVKVITETVEVEVYAPPLPPEIQLNDVEWKVITNTPCKPATGKKTLSQGKWYYTTERFEYEEYFDEEIFDYSKNEVNTLPLFLKNISKFELENYIEPVIMSSKEASKVVPDELDFLFIDGSHTFESARSDYKYWVKKLRAGGVLAIHDIYDSAEEGGQAPKEIYLKALDEGFKLLERRKSLVILKR